MRSDCENPNADMTRATINSSVRSLLPRRATLLVVILFSVTAGCGVFGQGRDESSTRILMRGQQPLTVEQTESGEDEYDLIARARANYSAGRLEEARSLLQELSVGGASESARLELQAQLALDLGDKELYGSTLLETLALHPDSATVQNSVGKRLVEHGEWEKGVSALRRAYEITPRNVEFARDLAAACLQRSDTARAAGVLEQAMRLNPHDVTMPMALARFHESAENWAEAVRFYDIALQADETNLPVRRLKARCLYRLGEFAAACDLYSSCIESSSSKVTLSEYAEYGDACLQTGDFDRAQMVYDRIARYRPVPNREVELLRIVCAVRRNDTALARRLLHESLTNWPGDDELLELKVAVEPADDSSTTTDSAE